MSDEQLRKELEAAKQRIAELEADLESRDDEHEELAILHLKLVKRERERELTRRKLEESESRFRALFENAHSIMLTINPDSGRIEDANEAAAEFYGYSVKQLKTMSIMQINTLNPKQIAKEMERATGMERNYFEFRHRLASGEIRDVEVFSGPSEVHGRTLLYSIIHDVTEKKQTEEALNIYKRIITSTPDMISLVDKDFTYRMVNDAYLKTFDKTKDEIIGKTVASLLGQEFFETVSKPRLQRAFQGETLLLDTTIELPRKGHLDLSVTYHPVKNEAGDIDYVVLIARDVTDVRQSQKALEEFSDRLALATDAGMIGIWEYDVISGNLIWDDIMMNLYRVEPAQFSATYEDWRSRLHPEDLAEAESKLQRAIREGAHFTDEFRIVWPNGQTRYIKMDAIVQSGDDGIVERITGVNQDITETRKLEEKLRRLATTDALTGANNRRHFMTRGFEEFSRSKRYETPTTMLTLDIDLFKRINDTHGHPVGDEVLKSLVTICRATLRNTDIFARMGGEEFSALLPETSLEDGVKTAERLRKAVEASRVMAEDEVIKYTISIGVADLQKEDTTLATLMQRADRALYSAKDRGRNRVETA